MASLVSDNGGTRQVSSPANPIASVLVVRIVNLGQERNSESIIAAHASSKCSQWSNTSSTRASLMTPTSVSIADKPGWTGKPKAFSIEMDTQSRSVTVAKSQSQRP
ncbi:Uncharacterised protein [Mycobacterium tuberculosis]|nr:Uncharacterised protein [Mycobacterium tuberculosis]CKR48159.1 Uncharacterised protein [Mycobacterium tuberculosis]CKS04401.1 Uncharacterised protein [Mycobacterium tuberculosis]COW14929.1 Uncharacterised protein [Mycobacterium tuberculosis]COW55080.1 Uncharacterised protein [Mycobacterium tuberculosis]